MTTKLSLRVLACALIAIMFGFASLPGYAQKLENPDQLLSQSELELAAPAVTPGTRSMPSASQVKASSKSKSKANAQDAQVYDDVKKLDGTITSTEPKPEGPAIDLEKSVTRALSANPQLQAAQAAIVSAEQSRRKAISDFGFVGTVSYGYSNNNTLSNTHTRTVSVYNPSSMTTTTRTVRDPKWSRDQEWALSFDITQPLFTGFRLLSTYQKAALNKDSASAQLKQTELDLILAVQEAFLSLLKGRSDVKSNQDAVTRLESQFQVTQAFYDVGLQPRLDVLQAEADLATAESTLLVSQNDVATQTAQLNSLLNMPLEQTTNYVGELTYLPFTLSVDNCLAEAYKYRPDLYIALKSVQMAEKDAKIALSPIYPQVNGGFNYTFIGDSPDLSYDQNEISYPESWTLSVQAQWQAWDWGSTYFNYRAAKESVKQLQAELANTRLNAGFSVKSAHLNIQDAAKRIGVARKGLVAAKEGYRMAVARYQAQVGTNTEVLDAQARVSTAETDLNQALADYELSIASIYYAMGKKNLTLTPQ